MKKSVQWASAAAALLVALLLAGCNGNAQPTPSEPPAPSSSASALKQFPQLKRDGDPGAYLQQMLQIVAGNTKNLQKFESSVPPPLLKVTDRRSCEGGTLDDLLVAKWRDDRLLVACKVGGVWQLAYAPHQIQAAAARMGRDGLAHEVWIQYIRFLLWIGADHNSATDHTAIVVCAAGRVIGGLIMAGYMPTQEAERWEVYYHYNNNPKLFNAARTSGVCPGVLN